MTFPATPVRPTLSPHEYDRLVKLLTVHYAYPLRYPLAGAFFEELFAACVGGVREERKLLFDILKDGVGWSLKTLLWTRLQPEGTFEVVVQRCDILKDRSLNLNSPVEVLGRAILNHFNNFCRSSAREQTISDPRAAFLVRNRQERDFVFFQQRYRLYQAREVRWQWANEERRSLMGYVGDSLVLRWYRSGTQLFGVYRIPAEPHHFHIDWRRAGLEETIEFFTRAGIARAETEA